MRRGYRSTAFVVVILLAVLAPAAGGVGPATETWCIPGQDGCLPTPEQCATGAYNGVWSGGYQGRLAVCVGGAGHVVQYSGGDANLPCGAVIVADQVVTGSWADPNRCPRADRPAVQGGPGSLFREAVRSKRGVVASASDVASEVGVDVLDAGGNAMDAAVATAFALSVARPDLAGIGGGGGLVYRSADGEAATLDFTPRWPAAVTQENWTPDSPIYGFGAMPPYTGRRVIGVPGTVAGLTMAVDRFGSLPLAQLIAPAEALARDGIVVTPWLADSYTAGVCEAGVCTFQAAPAFGGVARLRLSPASARTFLVGGMLPYRPGQRLVQPDLAWSLREIAAHGADAFYRGAIADRVVAEMERPAVIPGDEPLLTRADLEAYAVDWKTPLVSTYRGRTILSMPPPSVGGVMTAEVLNIMEGFDVAAMGHSSADYLHLFAEAGKIARIDADAYVADPAFTDVPVDVLTSKEWAAERRAAISMQEARSPAPGDIAGHDANAAAASRLPGHTAHISVIDAAGNSASITFTVGAAWGSAVTAAGTGILLNEWCCGDPDTNNAAQGGKFSRHPTTPTIAVDGNTPILVAGAAGGGRIMLSVIMILSNVIDFGMDVGRAVDVARAQSRQCCDLELEEWRVPSAVRAELERRGHTLLAFGEYEGVYAGSYTRAQLAAVDPSSGERSAASDPRNERGARAQI